MTRRERVARAIADRCGHAEGRLVGDAHWKFHLPDADAAIAAYEAALAEEGMVIVPREATEAMRWAGDLHEYGESWVHSGYCWHAMIAAWLGEKG